MSTILRFDFRVGPSSTSSTRELFAAALEMCEWGDLNGAASAMFSEHHGSNDGYLPSPIVLAAAAAARTSVLPINVGALLALMYDPIKLAEDMSVLDHLSEGRVSFTLGLGYRDSEYSMFGVDRGRRGALMDEVIEVLQRALSGESFRWRDRDVSIRPLPLTPGGPPLAYGGGTVAAARRAGRHGLMFLPQSGDPGLAAAYDEAATAAGHPAGQTLAPPPGCPTALFVSEDVKAAWERLGAHILHDALAYDTWNVEAGRPSIFDGTEDPLDVVRGPSSAYRIVTPGEAIELRDRFGFLSLHPLIGGCEPERAWETLRLIESHVNVGPG